jgi:hypothetical protein
MPPLDLSKLLPSDLLSITKRSEIPSIWPPAAAEPCLGAGLPPNLVKNAIMRGMVSKGAGISNFLGYSSFIIFSPSSDSVPV